MRHFRQSFSVLLLILILIAAAAITQGGESVLFALMMTVPLYLIYLAYHILRQPEESPYELKDGWYENF